MVLRYQLSPGRLLMEAPTETECKSDEGSAYLQNCRLQTSTMVLPLGPVQPGSLDSLQSHERLRW